MLSDLDNADPWWAYARDWAVALDRGAPAPSIAVYGPVLGDDEHARLCAPVTSERLITGDGSYQHGSTMVLGSVGLMAGVFAAQAMINSRRKRRARRESTPQWRFQRQATAIVTDERLMCTGPEGTFLDFGLGYVTEFYPDLAARTVTLAFGDQCAPLRLTGAAVPAIALWTADAIYGPQWASDVRLAPLLPPAQPALPKPTTARTQLTPRADRVWPTPSRSDNS